MNSPCFDRTHRLAIDKTAGVMFSKGCKFTNKKTGSHFHDYTCPKLKPIPYNSEDLTNSRIGRLIAVGLMKNKKGVWVVRCDCGIYETRKAKSLKNPNNFGDRCVKCRKIAKIKKSYIYEKTKESVDERTL